MAAPDSALEALATISASRVDLGWRCAGCGCTLVAASRRALRRGRALPSNAVTCGEAACKRERKRRLAREKYGKGSGYRYKMPPGWRCSACRCSVAEAHRKREDRGLSPLASRAFTCTPECARARRERLGVERRPEVESNQRAQRERMQARLAGDPALQALAARIRELRKAAELTQVALAGMAGLARSLITMAEGGRYRPSRAVLARLAKALRVSPGALTRPRGR